MPDFRVFAVTDLVIFATLATLLMCENLSMTARLEMLVRRLFVIFAAASVVCLAIAGHELVTTHYPPAALP